jgi:hypothetical protein
MLELTSAMLRGGMRKTVQMPESRSPVDVSHRPLVLVVALGSNSAQDMRGADLLSIIDQVRDWRTKSRTDSESVSTTREHRQPVLQRKSVALVWIDADGHDQSVKESNTLLDHPEMPDGKRIKAPGVNPQSFLCSHLVMVATNAPMSAAHARHAGQSPSPATEFRKGVRRPMVADNSGYGCSATMP